MNDAASPSGPRPAATVIDNLLREQVWLRRLARSLVHDTGAAEDLVQDAYLAALRHPPEDRPTLRPWLRKVAQNLAAMRLRAARGRTAREQAAVLDAPAEAPSPEDIAARLALHRLLAEEIANGLDEPTREVVYLRYFEDRSAADIARLLGVPAGTVRWRLKVGLDLLRGRLDQQHNGDRRRWTLVLAPLAGSPPVAASAPHPEPAAVPLAQAPGLGRVALVVAATTVVGLASVLAVRGTSCVPSFRPGAEVAPTVTAEVPSPPPSARRSTKTAVPVLLANQESRALDEQPPDMTVFGLVREVNGGPVGGALVVASRRQNVVALPEWTPAPFPKNVEVYTDGSGAFRLELESGDYTVEVVVDGYVPASHAVRGSRRLDFQLAPGSVLSGRVLDEGDRPAAGAQVVAVSRPPGFGFLQEGLGFQVETDGSGAFEIRQLPPGPLLVVAHLGTRAAQAEMILDAFGGPKSVVLRLKPASSLRGRVTTRQGAPAADVAVRVLGSALLKAADATTGPGGDYRIEGLSPGRYTVEALRKDMPLAAASVDIQVASQVRQLDLQLDDTAIVRGQVVGPDGVSLGGVGVQIAYAEEHAPRLLSHSLGITGPDGRFEGTCYAGKSLRAELESRKAEGKSELIELSPGDTRELVVKARPRRGLMVQGRVRWLEDETPAADVWVLAGHEQAVRTEADGTFVLGPLFDATIVEASRWGRAGARWTGRERNVARLSPEAGKGTVTVDLALTKKAISGTVIDRAGHAVGGAEVQWLPEGRAIAAWGDSAQVTFTDPDGRFAFDDPPASVPVRIVAHHGREGRAELAGVNPGQDVKLKLAAPEGHPNR
jgi:RNA polymerase sigma factor (sigma-70 family)